MNLCETLICDHSSIISSRETKKVDKTKKYCHIIIAPLFLFRFSSTIFVLSEFFPVYLEPLEMALLPDDRLKFIVKKKMSRKAVSSDQKKSVICLRDTGMS